MSCMFQEPSNDGAGCIVTDAGSSGLYSGYNLYAMVDIASVSMSALKLVT